MCGRRWLELAVVATILVAAAGKGKRHRNNKPGRALFDRLTSTTLSEVSVVSETSGRLVPPPLDVAPYSIINANATCGEGGAEEYCRETPGKRGVVCDVCEGPEGSPSRRHPALHAVDSDPSSWWQSPTLAAGPEYQHIELMVLLPDKMELLHVIIKSGPSPRPLAWSLEVSPLESGEDWHMVRAFGDRDHCRKLWDLRPERRRRKARASKRTSRADKPTCSTQFASPRPLENGEMHVAVGEGVVSRRVRISFRAAHASPSRQQYYTVRGITLAARCLCNGRADSCEVDTQGATCACVGDTCGRQCDAACGTRAACAHDDTGAELCFNCTDNRAGPLCDRCLFGFYNAVPDGPCEPCNCHVEGSDGSCIWDRKHRRVSCNCLPGFTGDLCDVCENSGDFPQCGAAAPIDVTGVPSAPTEAECKCDPRGIVDPAGVCDEVCQCKEHVVGERCDTCAGGHFGLSAAAAGGCRPCYCSHLADSCTLDTHFQPLDITLPLSEGWLVIDAQGKETVEPSIDEQTGYPFVISYEVEGWEHFYWISSSFSGEQFAAYGSDVTARVYWGVVRGDTGGSPTRGPDIVLVGADGTKLSCTNSSYETPGELEFSVKLLEGNWYIQTDGEHPELATRTQLMDVLRNVKGIMIRAHYHFDQDEVRLEHVSISGPEEAMRERCACGGGAGGAHCHTCAWGYVRAAGPTSACLPCACNNHAQCDTVDGPCGPCQHNTTGPNCERCLPGHYGNPVQGGCKPCACPLFEPSNNFSPNCVLASAHGDDYVCTQCPDGYTGDHCENCDFGYWGSPLTPGGRCEQCACGAAPCHADTGACLVCPDNTEGAKCDLCKEGYWWGASGVRGGAACVSCACGAGAVSVACDADSGACACRAGWAGRACDTCAPGHGDVSAGCPACRCGVGALTAACAPDSGTCACAAGAAPPYCDTCLDLHYGLDSTGCKGCNCSSIGSESNVCDIRTGQCRCRIHVTGRACDTCEEGYWGLERGGCKKCECGAGAAACDPVTGACACAPGVGGAQCDKCMPGFYGFSPAGCLPCPKCTDGKVCSPHSGRCVCPAGARGAGCRLCARGYYSHGGTCRPCACAHQALSNICDVQTGQCECRVGWTGQTCDKCAPGHYGPRCKPCGCDAAGTRGCTDGICPCDQWGRCSCKENVVGEKCDKCLEGTFGLSAENPAGCTACFCFGRAARCEQAKLTRGALHAARPVHLTLLRAEHDEITNMDQESLLAVHTRGAEASITLPQPPVPVYLELDERFLGDRLASYGGYLRYRIEEEGGAQLGPETLANFPLVRIYGRNIVLDYFEHVPAVNNTHAVRFHESLWRVRGGAGGAGRRRADYGAASRGALMLALMRVDRILLRATTRVPAVDDPVHALLLNVSMETALPGLSRSAPALGVELCECARQYAAPSCQLPAVGFWLPPGGVRLSAVAGTILIHMEAEAQPCNCNGRAIACDPHTGHCLNCTGGTSGARCEECAAGWYGSPAAPGGCRPCPCPAADRSHAAACHLRHGRLHCYCKPGYSGSDCSVCADGYYMLHGECTACACDARGAASPRCDAHGTCTCHAHAAGRKCDQCSAKRTYLDDDGCKPCDNCTQTLLDSVESLTSDLRRRANPTELSRIPKPFPAVRQFSQNASTFHRQLLQAKHDRENSRNFEITLRKLEEMEHRIITEANRLKTEASRRSKEAEYLSLESMSSLEEVLKQRGRIGEQVATLDEFARGERHLSAHRALKEARHLLRQIKDMKVSDYYAGANDVFDLANVQSTAVQEYNYRIEHTYRRLQQLLASLDQWEKKAADLPRLATVVWRADDAVTELKEKTKPKMGLVKDIGLRCRLVLEDITTLSSHNLTDDIGASILRAQGLSIQFPSLAAELEVLTLAAEEKEGILYNLTPTYKEKYLDAVEKHVSELSEKAKEYKSLFAGSRAVASRGVSAAHAWAEVAQGVKDAQMAAEEAVKLAHAAAALAQGPNSMIKQAVKGVNSSTVLAKKGADLLKKVEGVRGVVEGVSRGAALVRVLLRGAGWAERALGAPRAAVRPLLAAADAAVHRLTATTRALYDEASDLRSATRYDLRRRLLDLQKHGDTALGAAEEHVSQIRGDTARGAATAAALAGAAAARARQHAAAAAAMSPALAALREKLQRARHAANTISVSVTSAFGASAGCSRAYAAWAASGAATRLAIAVSFENRVRDGPLLHLVDDTQEKERYMKLSVVNKRLFMSWNLGGGSGMILHPEVLQPTHDDADHTSYRIEIERIWNTVYLNVERAGGSKVSATNSTAPNAVRLMPTALWLGAAPAQGSEARGSSGLTVGLPGCVHALYSDDMTLGLWNFHHQPKEAKCTGCTQRWVGSGRGSMWWLDGGGYAVLLRSGRRPPDPRHFSLSFTFRTTDENALLFAAVDTENNRSVSVVLESCRVQFVVQYSGARLRITAGGSHCDGRPAHVQAIRVFANNHLEKGSLRVNGEETLGSPSPPVASAAALPALREYWVGGAPPLAAPAPALPRAPPLLGCIGALTVDREAYDLLDAPRRHGVEPGCTARTLRSARLEGSGYIELPAPLFRRKAALGMSFLARESNGLLLYRPPSGDNEVEDDGDDKHYFALVMVDGDLELIASAGKAELRLRTNGTKFDDKNMHTVRIVRLHKQLELWVDETRVASDVLSGNAFSARPAGLYVGGMRGGEGGNEGAAQRGVKMKGFKGVVADLIVDSQLIGFETAVRWQNTGLGRGVERAAAPRRTEPRPLHAQAHTTGCAKSASYSVEGGAAKFGDGRGSHAALRTRRARRLAVAAQLRTYRDGLLFYIPGSKNKPKHYAALIIREGRLRLIVRGRKRKELALNGNVTDGVWRTVSISLSRSRVEVSCGGESSAGRGGPLARAQRLYVGGLPPHAVSAAPQPLVRVGGFRGCVRRVSVNGRAEDLVRDARDHRNVGQCFPDIEPAAYFGGDAYATWSSHFGAEGSGEAGEVSLEFRTTEPNGVLLSSPGLLLEIADGAVVATRLGAGGAEVARVAGAAGGGCGGRWLAARVGWRGGRVWLALGTAPALSAAAPALLDPPPNDIGPLHIAGLPEGTIDTSENGGKANFKGCIRNVTINGLTKDWPEMESLNNVLLDSCPITVD